MAATTSTISLSPDRTIGLYLGDVAGKGLPAAVYAALAVGNPCGIPSRHTAIQYAVFYPSSGEMVISSAGMPGPILLQGQDCCPLQLAGVPPGLFLGMMNSSSSFNRVIPCCACSDGLTEACHVQGREFGLAGIVNVAAATPKNLPLIFSGTF